jgi:hypothetical protein
MTRQSLATVVPPVIVTDVEAVVFEPEVTKSNGLVPREAPLKIPPAAIKWLPPSVTAKSSVAVSLARRQKAWNWEPLPSSIGLKENCVQPDGADWLVSPKDLSIKTMSRSLATEELLKDRLPVPVPESKRPATYVIAIAILQYHGTAN